jgi:putative transposase
LALISHEVDCRAHAKASAPGTQRDGTLRYTEGFAPRPVASPSQQGSNQPGTLLTDG